MLYNVRNAPTLWNALISLEQVLFLFSVCLAIALAAAYYRYYLLNKKYGSRLQPGGHPFGWYAIALWGAPYFASVFNINFTSVFSVLSIIATGVWLFFAVRDCLKSKAALANAPAPIAHEGIPGWGIVLKGLNHIYVDLSGIDTKVLVDSKIEIDSLKALIAEKLGSAGIELATTKASAKCWLSTQMKTQPGPKETGSVTTIYLQIGETLSNDRLDAIHVRANAPIFSTVTVAMCDGTPSAEAISTALEERLDQFLLERNS